MGFDPFKETRRVFDEVGRAIDKYGTKNVGLGDARRGRMTGSGWLSTSLGGTFSRATLGSANKFLASQYGSSSLDPVNRAKGTFRPAERAVGSSLKQAEASVYGANLGHQAIGREPGEGRVAPGVTDLPPVGTGTRNARQRARQAAIDAAKRRFGIGDTVATTPLGLQGDGASLGKKRLTGE